MSAKDNTTKTLIPDVISECALYLHKEKNEPCMSAEMNLVVAAITAAPIEIHSSHSKVLTHAMKETKCESERCVLESLSNKIGPSAKKEINAVLKIRGPTDSKLLSNINIDAVLHQWALNFTDFYPFSFNMRNYASYSFIDGTVVPKPDTLATVQFEDLYNGLHNNTKYRRCACVINTDVYQGSGKHWMALFADTTGSEWSVEFFNSSGNGPAPEWVNWLEKTKNQMEKIIESAKLPNTVKIVRATTIQHQNSRSECGVYSLFYIWARLNKIPYDYFMNNTIPDELMFECRQHIFDDPNRKALKHFDWIEYKKTTKILWE